MKIVSDGTTFGTKLFDSKGEPFDGHVEKITWVCGVRDGLARVTIELIDVKLDVLVDDKNVTLTPTEGGA